MKTNFRLLAVLFLGTMLLSSCSNDENNSELAPPSSAQFGTIRANALATKTQNFSLTAGSGLVSFTSTNGVVISLNSNNLTKNGLPVTGAVNLEFVALFDKGSMLVTNKPTMGRMANGDKNLLISGGEFFVQATQGNVDLAITSNIQLVIPSDLTGGIDDQMLLWNGNTDDPENLVWNVVNPGTGGPQGGGIGFIQNSYYLTFGSFGWSNVDKFYNDPRPKTTILAGAPVGYDNANSAIYLSYDGEGTNALAKLDTYNAATSLFSEHYGQIPIGLACHVIFATESNGQWRYAIKGVTVAANDVYNFTLSETTVGTEAQLIAAVNAIQ